MELLVWHEALGCDDEQASDPELLARVLYSYSATSSSSGEGGDGDASACLQTLHFVQGLLAFVRMLKRSDRSDNNAGADGKEGGVEQVESESVSERKCLEWISVTLSKRKFFVQEVEPQIYIALVRYFSRCCVALVMRNAMSIVMTLTTLLL